MKEVSNIVFNQDRVSALFFRNYFLRVILLFYGLMGASRSLTWLLSKFFSKSIRLQNLTSVGLSKIVSKKVRFKADFFGRATVISGARNKWT